MLIPVRTHDPVTDLVTINFAGKPPKRYKEHFENFFSEYEIVHLLIDDKNFQQDLKPKKDRICRFCKKNSKETSFSSKAHLISELLGNKSVLTDGECNNCNQDFSIYENDLANYIGAARAFAPKRGKKGFPVFKNPNGGLVIREGFMNEDDRTKKILFEFDGTNTEVLSFDPTKKNLED